MVKKYILSYESKKNSDCCSIKVMLLTEITEVSGCTA